MFKGILHDWSDAECVTILTQTAKAMKSGYSKLLVSDMVLRDVGEGVRGASLDIVMFMMPEGKERTLSEFEALLDAAGLKLAKQWPGEEGMESVLEAELI